MRTLSRTLVAAAVLMTLLVVVVGAAPAFAVTGGFGVSKALRGTPLPVTLTDAAGKTKHTFCESAGSRTKASQAKVGKVAKQFVPVACEQPPRSQLSASDALKQATAAAFAVLG